MADSVARQRATYPLASYNFRVIVGQSVMSFTEVSGLKVEYETLTYTHGLGFWEGQSIVRFRYDKYVPITLKKGVVAGDTAISTWLSGGEPRALSVSLCDETGTAVVTWQVKQALVVKVELPSLQASSNDAAIETLTLMVSGVSLEHH